MPSWYVNTPAMLSHRANSRPGASPNVDTKSACDLVALMTSHPSGSRQYSVNRAVIAVRTVLFRGLSTVESRRLLAGGIPQTPHLYGVRDGDRERRHHERERRRVTLLGPGERQVVGVQVGRVEGGDAAVGHHRRQDLRLVEHLEGADDREDHRDDQGA